MRNRKKGDGERGAVEVGVAMAGALLIVGAVVGNGVASTLVEMSDGATWLPEDDRGTVVQINPATGEAERRLQIAAGESDLEIAQRDGRLIVTDRATGEITAIDLSTLLASGQRTAADPDGTRILVGGGHVAMVELGEGVVRAVSPLTMADIGTPYRTDPIADAAIDDSGRVWVIGEDGALRELEYDADAREHRVRTDQDIEAAGPSTRLLPHDRGVTVFAPDRGAVVQVGAGNDITAGVPQLEGSVEAAPRSPSDLAPASLPEQGRVVVLSGRSVLAVDVAAIGCERPAQPQVFAGRIYVPCTGAGRVVVLAADGTRAAPDIVVPGGGDPRITVDEGRLVVHTRDGSGRYVLVDGAGTTRVVEPEATDVAPVPVPVDRPVPQRPQTPRVPAPAPPQPSTPAPNPGQTLPPVPTDTPSLPTDTPSLPTDVPSLPTDTPSLPTGTPTETGTQPPTSTGTEDPTGTGPTSGTGTGTGTPPTGDYAPRRVQVAPVGDGTRASVTWQASQVAPVRYQVTASVGTGQEVDADAELVSALTGLRCGTDVLVRVTAVHEPAVTEPVTREVTYATPACEGTTPPSGPPTSDPPEPTTTTDPPAPPTTTDPPAPPTTSDPPAAPQATAATNVTATLVGTNVRVSWTAATSGADHYVVQPQGGGGGTTAPAGTTSVDIAQAPGQTVSYVVVTQLTGSSPVTSAPSAPVTTPVPATAPGTPSVSVTVTQPSLSQVQIDVSIGAPADGGSAITNYRLDYSGPGVSNTVSLGTQTSFSTTVDCAGQTLCRDGGTVSASVTATNGVGDSAPGTNSGSLAAAQIPRDGDGVLSGYSTVESTHNFRLTIEYRPITTWSTTPGYCEASANGGPFATIDCGTAQVVATGTGRRNVGADASATVRFTGTGSAAGIVATSSASETRPGEAYCEPGGPCYVIASLPDTDVEIVPLPWTPPQVPNPPVVGAGVLMLGLAGALRVRRGRGDATADLAAPTDPTTLTDAPVARPTTPEHR
ncbi:hypothetical protein [Serinibacter arcticus]|uniref:hypothetical protein n=1 Tax=Serinibacter arcticus TaxID=1655435 RepID=UPI0011B28F5A|nr:hypothetical protein [Serinibacter arcticus]